MAAGDFMLMAAHHWHELRGYSEVPTNMEVDSHMCVVVAAAGLKQSILQIPKRIFHQYHGGQTRLAREKSERDVAGSVGERLWRMIGYLFAGQEHRTRRARPVNVILNGEDYGLCCFLVLALSLPHSHIYTHTHARPHTHTRSYYTCTQT